MLTPPPFLKALSLILQSSAKGIGDYPFPLLDLCVLLPSCSDKKERNNGLCSDRREGMKMSTQFLLQALKKIQAVPLLVHGAALPWAEASSLIAPVQPHLVCMSTTAPSREGVFLRRISSEGKFTLLAFQPSYRRLQSTELQVGTPNGCGMSTMWKSACFVDIFPVCISLLHWNFWGHESKWCSPATKLDYTEALPCCLSPICQTS